MNEEARRELLTIARDALVAAVTKETALRPASKSPELDAKGGAFVTLKNKERLRGCIGVFVSDEPLARVSRGPAVRLRTEVHQANSRCKPHR